MVDVLNETNQAIITSVSVARKIERARFLLILANLTQVPLADHSALLVKMEYTLKSFPV
jgi:hypothetical protein